MTKDLRHIAREAVLLFVSAAALYGLFAFVLNNTDLHGRRVACYAIPYLQRHGGQEVRMFSEQAAADSADIIVVGSSHAYRGYDPREFSEADISLFNAGTSSQHIAASYFLLKEYLQPDSQQLVIIDLYDDVYDGEVIECDLRLIENAPDGRLIDDLVEMRPDMRLFNAVVARAFSLSDQPEMKLEGYVGQGYVENAASMEDPLPEYAAEFSADPLWTSYLDSTLGYLEEAGVDVVLVSHPMPDAEGYEELHEAFLEDVMPVIDHYDVPFFDLTLDSTLNDLSLFADPTHLNQRGVTLFNERLIDLLEDHQLLPQP